MITMAGEPTHSKEKRNVTRGRAVELEYEYVSTTTHIHKAAMVNEEERSLFTERGSMGEERNRTRTHIQTTVPFSFIYWVSIFSATHKGWWINGDTRAFEQTDRNEWEMRSVIENETTVASLLQTLWSLFDKCLVGGSILCTLGIRTNGMVASTVDRG